MEYYDPLGYIQRKTANIDRLGKFKLSIFLLYPQDIQIQSGTGYYIRILVVPMDTTHMALRYFKIKQALQSYPEVHYRTDLQNPLSGANAKRYKGFLANYLKAGKQQLVASDNATVSGGVNLLNEKPAKVAQTVN